MKTKLIYAAAIEHANKPYGKMEWKKLGHMNCVGYTKVLLYGGEYYLTLNVFYNEREVTEVKSESMFFGYQQSIDD